MRYVRKQISGLAVWALVLMILWGTLPSSFCVCANGNVMLFCKMHEQLEAAKPLDNDSCCSVKKSEQTVGCCGQSQPIGSRWTSKGCTRVTNSQSVATMTASSKLRPAVNLDQSDQPIDPTFSKPVSVALADSRPSPGPPTDLVISLHRLLI